MVCRIRKCSEVNDHLHWLKMDRGASPPTCRRSRSRTLNDSFHNYPAKPRGEPIFSRRFFSFSQTQQTQSLTPLEQKNILTDRTQKTGSPINGPNWAKSISWLKEKLQRSSSRRCKVHAVLSCHDTSERPPVVIILPMLAELQDAR